MERQTRILSRETIDHRGHKPRSHCLRTANAQLAGVRFGQEVELLDALTQLIEHGDAALQQCMAIDGGLNAVRTAIDQAQPHGVLDVGNRL